MKKFGILAEMFDFLKNRKIWWMTPIIVILILLGFLLVFAQSSPLAPFIYTMF